MPNPIKDSNFWSSITLQTAISIVATIITAMLFLGDMRTAIKLNEAKYERLDQSDKFLKELYETKLNSLTDMVKEMNKKVDELQKDIKTK